MLASPHENSLAIPDHVAFNAEYSASPIALFNADTVVADGRYRLNNILSVTRNNDVYHAVDQSTETAVAFKVFHEASQDVRQRVDTELSLHADLTGEAGILPAHDMGIIDEGGRQRRYLATSLRAGDLDKFMVEHHGDIDALIFMSSLVLPGMQAVHDRGYVHRDVKPNNIYGSKEDWALGDFGIACVRNDHLERPPLEAVGNLDLVRSPPLGTIGFVAPEVYKDQEIGPKADVFALGVTIFAFATGMPPFRHSTNQEYRLAVTKESPVSVRALNRSVPAELSDLTRECLRKDPNDRPTVEELERRIEAI